MDFWLITDVCLWFNHQNGANMIFQYWGLNFLGRLCVLLMPLYHKPLPEIKYGPYNICRRKFFQNRVSGPDACVRSNEGVRCQSVDIWSLLKLMSPLAGILNYWHQGRGFTTNQVWAHIPSPKNTFKKMCMCITNDQNVYSTVHSFRVW